MANISREDDLKDFAKRTANGGKRPHVCNDVRETREEALARTEAEVAGGLQMLRRLEAERMREIVVLNFLFALFSSAFMRSSAFLHF